MKGLVMKKLLAFFALMLWLVSTIFAQATIEGSVYEQDGLTPIEGAEIFFQAMDGKVIRLFFSLLRTP